MHFTYFRSIDIRLKHTLIGTLVSDRALFLNRIGESVVEEPGQDHAYPSSKMSNCDFDGTNSYPIPYNSVTVK